MQPSVEAVFQPCNASVLQFLGLLSTRAYLPAATMRGPAITRMLRTMLMHHLRCITQRFKCWFCVL